MAEYQVNNTVTNVSTGSLSAGMYILQLVGGVQNTSIRFTKQ